jgi:transposase
VINLDDFALKKGHGNFALVISAPEEGCVLEVLPNRERETLEKWLTGLSTEQQQAITVVNVDMWEPYTLAIKTKLPHATIVIDRFHVMKNLNHCLTQARREIQNNSSAEVKAQLKGSRWVLVKNQTALNEKERAKPETIYRVSPELKICHELKELFRLLFDTLTDREEAKQTLQIWIQQAEALAVKALKPFLVTLRNWFEQILNYFIGNWTNAFAEGVNNKIKLIKRRAFGYTNFDHLRLHILVEFTPNPT